MNNCKILQECMSVGTQPKKDQVYLKEKLIEVLNLRNQTIEELIFLDRESNLSTEVYPR